MPIALAAGGRAVPDDFAMELQAVCTHLNAQAPDVTLLLGQVSTRDVSRQQVQGLLERAYTRLQALRLLLDGFHAKRVAPETMTHIHAAQSALQPGEGLSLPDADAALEGARLSCLGHGAPTDNAARLCSAQAVLAGVSLDFRRAASLSGQAAALAHADRDACREYLSQQAEFLHDQGREFLEIEALQEAVALYEKSLLPMVSASERPDQCASIHDRLGNTLGILGQRQRGTRMLDLAIAAFEASLVLRDRERQPLDWAVTQNNLGNALGILGQRQHDSDLVERSIAAFEVALEVQTREQHAEAWATTQNNLAAVLQTLGQQRKDTKLLKRAVDAYKAVLTIWTRERLPLVWAATMSNLGSALRLLGEHRKGPRTLEQSVAAYNAALSVRTRGRVPGDWAMTQNNLGAALQALGERTGDSFTLGKSVAAYRETLKEWSRDREPMSWAMTMANLGVARRKLAERNDDVDISRQASADIKMAVDVFRGASHAKLTELGEEQLALSRKLTVALESAAGQ